MNKHISLLIVVMLAGLEHPTFAQITPLSIPLCDSPMSTFDVPPKIGEVWSTYSQPGTGEDFASPSSLSISISSLSALLINQNIKNITNDVFLKDELALYNPTRKALQTTPGSNGYTVVMATLRNDTGLAANSLKLTFDFAMTNVATEQNPGYTVYYSMTGLPGQWYFVPELYSVAQSGTYSVDLAFFEFWQKSALMHIIWVDDNANQNKNSTCFIDNVRFEADPGFIYPTVVVLTQDVTVNEGSDAVFQMYVQAAPCTKHFFQWYRDSVLMPGATKASLVISNATVADNGIYHCVATNELGRVTGRKATLTVIADTTPPILTGARFNDKDMTEIVVVFSESVDIASACDMSHYQVISTGGGTSIQIAFITNLGPAKIRLVLTSAGQVGASYQLSASNILDKAVQPNVMVHQQIPVWSDSRVGLSPFTAPRSGPFRMELKSAPGWRFGVDASTNLFQWSRMTNVTVSSNGVVPVHDQYWRAQRQKFYRIIELP